MRTTILFCSLILVASLEPASPQTKNPPQPKKSSKGKSKSIPHQITASMLLEPDSPITIQDSNSIHFYKDNDFYISSDPSVAVTIIDTSLQLGLLVVGCSGVGVPPGCTVATSSPVRLAAPHDPWYVALYDKSNKKVIVVSYPDSSDNRAVKIESVPKHKFSPESADNSGVYQPNDHFASARVCVKPMGSACAVTEQEVGCPKHQLCTLTITPVP